MAAIVDTKEQKKMEAHFQTGTKEQEAKFLINEKGVKTTIKEDLKQEHTLYIKNCEDCEYVIAGRCTKILIEGCKRCKITLKGRILTNVVEAWRCDDSEFLIHTEVKTLQLDLCKKLALIYEHKNLLHQIIWAQVYDLDIQFLDKEPSLKTGYDHVKDQYTDINPEIDQFIIRYVQGKLTSEQVVRLTNGYPTTQREADEFDTQKEKNEKAAEEFVKNRLKQAGITLGRKPASSGGKVGRNEVCPCGSGKKSKKCCNK